MMCLQSFILAAVDSNTLKCTWKDTLSNLDNLRLIMISIIISHNPSSSLLAFHIIFAVITYLSFENVGSHRYPTFSVPCPSQTDSHKKSG